MNKIIKLKFLNKQNGMRESINISYIPDKFRPMSVSKDLAERVNKMNIGYWAN